MHDILEGVLQYEIKEMLKNYIKVEHYLTLEVLNSRIAKYDFGYYNDKNRPSPITEQKLSSNDNNLKQHGMYSKLNMGIMSWYLTGLDKFRTCVLICMYINTVQVVLTTFINIILCKSIEDLTTCNLFMYQYHYGT